MTGKYDDIINLPHHRSDKHPQMSLHDRAAQFSPFAALTGHSDAVKETARLTDRKVELDEGTKEYLSAKLTLIEDNLDEQPEVSITYFVVDERKSGGAYITTNGVVKKINEYEHSIMMQDRTVIPIDDILSIDGELFDQIDEY